jgi:hypothetical protein
MSLLVSVCADLRGSTRTGHNDTLDRPVRRKEDRCLRRTCPRPSPPRTSRRRPSPGPHGQTWPRRRSFRHESCTAQMGRASAIGRARDQPWGLISTCRDTPLVEIRWSGRTSGAFLTLLGRGVLARFRQIQRAAGQAIEPHLREFEQFVGMDPNKPPPIPRFAKIIDPSILSAPKKKSAKRLKNNRGARKAAEKKLPRSSRRKGRR